MRQLRTILRLRLQAKLSLRQIKTSLRLSLGAVQKICSKAEALDLDWPAIEQLDDQQLASRFYPQADTRVSSAFQLPDWSEVYRELKRKGMTRLLLWEEYTQQYPNRCYSYPQYCMLYQQWQKKQKRSMRQHHKAGEKLFVDYAGQTVPVVQQDTGEIQFARIFVAVLGASNYTYAEATWSQRLPDWIGSHVRTFEFIKGVPVLLIPDNLKSSTTRACRYDPDINMSYQQMAAHYGTAIVPARPRKPQDKAKAEVGVQIIERWILARLRHQTFFSLTELNQQIHGLLEEVNNKPFKQLKGTRQQWFDLLDKPALLPLPKQAFEFTEIKTVKVNVDYHIQFDGHLYSVPHHLVGEKPEVHAKAFLIEMYFHNRCICQHARQYHSGTTTVPAHMPERHKKHHQWTPGRLMNWAKDIDYLHPGGLQQSVMASLLQCDWLNKAQNILFTGPCGSGKTFIACAPGHTACMKGHSVKYYRLSRLLMMLTRSKADGTYLKTLQSLAKTELLIIDDWGLELLKAVQRNDLMELMDDRHGHASTIMLSQLPTDQWHQSIGDNTIADAILDRLMHNAHRLKLKGESMRKTRSSLTDGEHLG